MHKKASALRPPARRYALLLCVSFALQCVCCSPKTDVPEIVWDNDKATAIILQDTASIYVEGSPYRVLGEWDHSRFTPAVPFERGQTYHTSTGITFIIHPDTTLQPPVLTGSFPSCDTVPSNLLKIYLQFSQPMSEGRSSKFVQLFDAISGDTIKNAFLDLRPELWNGDGTILTLWLDPGRIKQDLIPNKNLGVVMTEHRKYKLVVAKGWRSKNGLALEKDYNRTYTTSKRDVTRPDIHSWSIGVKGDTVVVDLKESLDWLLLQSAISIPGLSPKTITGPGEKKIFFFPVPPGDYSLNIESRLEDLCGNNINRLFETDVTASAGNNHPKEVYTIPFHVK